MRGPLSYLNYNVPPVTPAGTVPTNIWTLEEVAAMIAASVEDILSERHESAPPVTDQDIAELTRVMLVGIICAAAPAGNA